MTTLTPGMICTHDDGSTVKIEGRFPSLGAEAYMVRVLNGDGQWSERLWAVFADSLTPCAEPIPGDEPDPPVIEDDGFITVDTRGITEQVALVADDGTQVGETFAVNIPIGKEDAEAEMAAAARSTPLRDWLLENILWDGSSTAIQPSLTQTVEEVDRKIRRTKRRLARLERTRANLIEVGEDDADPR